MTRKKRIVTVADVKAILSDDQDFLKKMVREAVQ